MAIQDTAPCSTDLLQPTKYILAFPRLTSTQFFCQAVNVPGVSKNRPVQTTPFVDLKIPGDKLQFDDLIVTFLLDDQLQAWKEIFYWLQGVTFPEEFNQYENLRHLSRYSEQVPFPQYADAELTILSTINKPTVKFKFKDCFPTQLSGIPLDIREDASHTMTATATFNYKYYTLENLI